MLVRYSMFMMSFFLIGLFILGGGIACLIKGISMHKKGDISSSTITVSIGSVLLVLGPVLMALAILIFSAKMKQLDEDED